MRHAKSLNQNQMRSNTMAFLVPQESIRGSGKTQKLYDLMSVIQDGGDSFASGEQLLEQFKQFGLQTVVIPDESFSKIPEKQSNKSFTPHTHYYHSNKNLDVDNILDFSNMVKAKQNKNKKIENFQNSSKYMRKLKNIKINILDTKNIVNHNLLQTNKKLKELRQQCEQNYLKMLNFSKNKIIQTIQLYEKNQQNLKAEIKQLKIHISDLISKNNTLKEKNKLQYSNNQSRISNKEEKTKQLQMSGLEVLSYNIKINEQMSKQFQKHSQKLKQTNKQIQHLNEQIESLSSQNKKLKMTIAQYEKKLKIKQNVYIKNSQNLDIYNQFLQKIQQLQTQINELRKSQKIQKRIQISPNMQQQLTQLNQFLVICEEKEKNLIQRQKQIQRKQKQINLRNIHYNVGQYRRQQNQRSPKSVYFLNIESPRKSISQQFSNEKLMKISKSPISPQNNHFQREAFSNREDITKSISRSSLGNLKQSEHISNRLSRIQNSITRELYELRYH